MPQSGLSGSPPRDRDGGQAVVAGPAEGCLFAFFGASLPLEYMTSGPTPSVARVAVKRWGGHLFPGDGCPCNAVCGFVHRGVHLLGPLFFFTLWPVGWAFFPCKWHPHSASARGTAIGVLICWYACRALPACPAEWTAFRFVCCGAVWRTQLPGAEMGRPLVGNRR